MANSDATLAELLSELQQVLEEERRTLLAGNPARIGAIVERKLGLAKAIEGASTGPDSEAPDTASVLALDRYNRGNWVICSAMLRHLAGTLDRLRRRDCHRSYGPDGAERGAATHGRLGAA